ncbi:hypothetical protein [Halocatena marina]|uniref:Uncharacterized protein n=1 Tax=Halocatena marina TaxID=2934937 RepID=A0ABD5YVC7_9EURY|nr:hypothetical protein [Halocatena marina]
MDQQATKILFSDQNSTHKETGDGALMIWYDRVVITELTEWSVRCESPLSLGLRYRMGIEAGFPIQEGVTDPIG